LAQLLGVDKETAERIGDGVAGALVAARVAAIRAGRISLAAHEAQGGHTIARHVGRTETELRARLASQKSIPAASTFQTLAQAEHAVTKGLQANRVAIAQWARTVAPGAKQAFVWASSSPMVKVLFARLGASPKCRVLGSSSSNRPFKGSCIIY
jgi:hypothetical protein